MLRYLDQINDDKSVRTLIQGAIAHIKKTIKKRGQTDIELKTLWLSNTLRLLHCLKQYSGDEAFKADSTAEQVTHCLRNFDLSAYRRVLSDIAVWIYQGITKVMEEEMQPVLVVAILEHEGITGLTNDKPRGQHRARTGSTDNHLDGAPGHLDPKEALDQLLLLLTKFHMTLQKHGLDPEIISQIFRQIFYYLCAGALNNLLLRKDMCHWSRGMQIRYNVAQLEQWARDQNLEDNGTKVIDVLIPLVQATQLLQARKSEEDVAGITDMCDQLRVSQIIKILNLYTPADEFEERVSPAFVRKIQNKLQERAMEEAKNQVGFMVINIILMMAKLLTHMCIQIIHSQYLISDHSVDGHQVQFRCQVPIQPVQHQPGGAGHSRALRRSPGTREESVERTTETVFMHLVIFIKYLL